MNLKRFNEGFTLSNRISLLHKNGRLNERGELGLGAAIRGAARPKPIDALYQVKVKQVGEQHRCYMDVSKNRGGNPPKWMVRLMENPTKMDDLGYHYFWKHPYVKTPVG